MRLHEGFQHLVTGARHGRHHAIRTDGDDAVCVFQRYGLHAEVADRIGVHALHDVADEGLVLRACRRKTRLVVTAPHHYVGRSFDLLDLVAVDHLLVAREVQHFAAGFAHRLAYREQHRITQAAAHQRDRFVRGNFSGRAGRPHQNHRLTRLQHETQVAGTAHLQHDRRYQAAFAIHPCASKRQAFHAQTRAFNFWRGRFKILQTVELARLKAPRGQRRAHHDFDNHRRQPLHLVYCRAQLIVKARKECCIAHSRSRRHTFQHFTHDRMTLLRAADGFHHVAEKRRMHVAEVAHAAAVSLLRQ